MDDTVQMKGEAELADMLQKSLKGKRYLIVLDDMWKSEAWDAVRLCFPSGNKGSGILLKTRNTEVARDVGTENLSLQMGFMDQDESWNILKSATSANEALSYEFETIGKQIVDECHGLPLTIVVVAGLLKSKRAIDNWKSVAKDVRSLVTNDPDELCSRVLGLSYNHLPSDLKACLLHFWIFPEDGEIPVKNLMRSWMAEGFLKLENDLEGEAEKCLQELVDRCLVLVCKKSQDGTKIRSCKVHDLIHDLCLREVQRGNVFIMNDIVLDVSDSGCRSLSIHKMQPFKRMTGDEIDYCPQNLDVPPAICRLWNLQTFIVQGSVIITFPEEIWGLMQLRHLKLPGFYLPDCPSGSVAKEGTWFFQIYKHCCTKEVILGIQNVKELGICGYEADSNSIQDSGLPNNLVHLQQLETLSFIGSFHLLPSSAKAFPATLKKLKLRLTLLSWSYLDIIAELPNLEDITGVISNNKRVTRSWIHVQQSPFSESRTAKIPNADEERCIPCTNPPNPILSLNHNSKIESQNVRTYDDDDDNEDNDDDEVNSDVDVAKNDDNEDSDVDAAVQN
ncbi:hypothetical protein CQW23_06526 [Capsicum baccatum]|uniref:Uncharacterized protein n=1 Tax=Capsicum baccatum TaxID=33114 RepID=A0A2G2X3J4_CAPBA|nr:hypothetical protein CQW23_06526 [Capsicum baccatum]